MMRLTYRLDAITPDDRSRNALFSFDGTVEDVDHAIHVLEAAAKMLALWRDAQRRVRPGARAVASDAPDGPPPGEER